MGVAAIAKSKSGKEGEVVLEIAYDIEAALPIIQQLVV